MMMKMGPCQLYLLVCYGALCLELPCI